MLKPIDVAQLTEWSWEGDKSESPSVFLLRPLTKRQHAKLKNETLLPVRREIYGQDGRLERVESVQQSGGASTRYAKMGLAGVKEGSFHGWADEAPTPDLCTTARVPTDAFLDSVPDSVLEAMALKIQQLSTVTEADAGKSSPPST